MNNYMSKNRATDTSTSYDQRRNKLTMDEIQMQSPAKQIYFPTQHINIKNSQSIDFSRKSRNDSQSINRAQTVNCVKDYVIKQPKKDQKKKTQIQEMQRNILNGGVNSYEIKDSFNNIVINYAPNFTTISPKNHYKPQDSSNNQKLTAQDIYQKYQKQCQNQEYKQPQKYIQQHPQKRRVQEYSQTLDYIDIDDIKYNQDQAQYHSIVVKNQNNYQQKTIENIKNCIEKQKTNQQPSPPSERQNRHLRDVKYQNMIAARTLEPKQVAEVGHYTRTVDYNRTIEPKPVEVYHKRKIVEEKIKKLTRNQLIINAGLNILNRFIQRKKGVSFLIQLVKYSQKN